MEVRSQAQGADPAPSEQPRPREQERVAAFTSRLLWAHQVGNVLRIRQSQGCSMAGVVIVNSGEVYRQSGEQPWDLGPLRWAGGTGGEATLHGAGEGEAGF